MLVFLIFEACKAWFWPSFQNSDGAVGRVGGGGMAGNSM